MRVICKANTAGNLDKETREMRGYSEDKTFAVRCAEVCLVYGISLWSSSLCYLLMPQGEKLPNWYPSELFEVSDTQLPFEWYVDCRIESDIRAVWGYKELVVDKDHHNDLLAGKNEALKIFMQRKIEIDEYL